MKKIILVCLLCLVASISFGQLRVGVNGTFGTTTNVPLIFDVNSVRSGFTGSSSNSNVSFGYEALLNSSSGGWNAAFGWKALRNTTGSYNTAIGFEALLSNSSGIYNTASGINALRNNTTASWNTAYGGNALLSNTTGSANTASGSGALQNNLSGSDNSAFGANALQNNLSNANTATGNFSLGNNTTGGGNSAFGIGALADNTTGSNNTAIGYWTKSSANNLNNTTAIGNGATVTASNMVRIGNASVTRIEAAVNVISLSDGRIKKNVRSNVPGIEFIRMLLPVTYTTDLDAMDRITDAPKRNETDPHMVLIDKEARAAKEKIVYTGFIAQDVEKAAQAIGFDFSGVDAPPNEKSLYGLSYAEFVVPLVKAVQELSEQNDLLKEQISELKEEVAMLASVAISVRSTTDNDLVSDLSQAVLYQNAPNPFTDRTEIKFNLPGNAVNASIFVFNMQGALMKQLPVNARQSSVIINGSELAAGMYLYSLIVEGKIVDTKRMILTK